MKDTTVEKIITWIINNCASDEYRKHIDTVMTLGEAELQNRVIDIARRKAKNDNRLDWLTHGM